MNFPEMPPSKQWAALKFKGEKFAEVWFKPEGEPCGLTFRIPQQSFQLPGLSKHLTIENLLKAVAIAPQQVEFWRHGDISHSGMNGSSPDFKNAFSPPSPQINHLEIHVRLIQESAVCQETAVSSQQQAADPAPDTAPPSEQDHADEIVPANWHDLETKWKSIVGLESAIDTLRLSMDSLLTEMEGTSQRSLSLEEKNHALRADIAQWQKVRSRVQTALPKMRDFIHRAVWAMGTPERKRLEEIYKEHIQPQVPFPRMDEVLKQLEELQKDRQVLSGLGTTVLQECKGLSADMQGTLRMLQSNASANALKKRSATGGRKRF